MRFEKRWPCHQPPATLPHTQGLQAPQRPERAAVQEGLGGPAGHEAWLLGEDVRPEAEDQPVHLPHRTAPCSPRRVCPAPEQGRASSTLALLETSGGLVLLTLTSARPLALLHQPLCTSPALLLLLHTGPPPVPPLPFLTQGPGCQRRSPCSPVLCCDAAMCLLKGASPPSRCL